MSKTYYSGQEGALRFIIDVTDDYDNSESVESLQGLVDEVRQEAIRALTQKEHYNIQCGKLK